MHITIDTNEALSARDIEILGLLTGAEPVPTKSTPAPAKKAAAAKPAPEPEPEPEPETGDDEDLVGGAKPTMADAVALATKLVSAGQSGKVKEALADAGAKRVSELSEDAIPGFVAALSD